MDRDGLVELVVSDDGMTATATFLPPVGEGRLLEPNYVDTLLDSRGVVYGIDTDSIGETVFAVNTERRIREDVVVARGAAPVAARPAYWELIAERGERKPQWSEAERAEYREVTLLPVVHAGDVIARRIPEREGRRREAGR